MKKSSKALLLSALLFPGTGYFAVKQRQRGMIVAVIALFALGSIIQTIMHHVFIIVDKVSRGEIPADTNLTKIVEASMQTDSTALNIASYILVACWIGSSIDGYRLGKKLDQNT